jgi:hypothetical protein
VEEFSRPKNAESDADNLVTISGASLPWN